MEFFWILIIIAIIFEVLSWTEKTPDQISMEEMAREPNKHLTSNELAFKERKKTKQEAYLARRKEHEEQKKIQAFRDEIKRFERSVGVYD